jgi:hypothetical protein
MEVDFLEMGGPQAARWLYVVHQKEACDEVHARADLLCKKDEYYIGYFKLSSKGRRRPGRPLKRLLDDVNAETETGHPGLNS